jgi:TM2 domain-containing membrane protein YozV
MVKLGSTEWWSNLVTYLLLSLTLGIIGIDRFYKGEVLWGVLKLISVGGFGIWYIVDIAIHAYRFGATGQWTKGSISPANAVP